MITDTLDNLHLYHFGNEILEFISNIKQQPKLGRYVISDDIYANVETYSTKTLADATFESHDEYIDIQILLEGKEFIYYTNKNNLTLKVPYDASKDIAFFEDKVEAYPKIELNGSNFVVLYPHEAHAPQVLAENVQTVTKLVIKIKYSSIRKK